MRRVFSYEKRVEAIKLFTEEEVPSEQIAKKFGTGASVIERWIRIYKVHGYAGLKIKPYNMVYDQAFKDKVIKDVVKNHTTRTTAAAKYNLSHSTITQWCIEYTRGIKMNGKRNIISAQEAAELRAKYRNTKDPILKAALVKNEYLEMENEILKKLATLTQKQAKKKQG